MFSIKAIWTLLRSPAARWLGTAVAVACLAGWAYLAIDGRGYARCGSEHEMARLQGIEKQMDATLDEIERGEKISAQLFETQRRLAHVERQYLAYAHGITGNCPGDLGVLVGAAASGIDLPAAAGPSADPAATIAAAAIAENIATNYPLCHAAIAQLDALIDFHTGSKKDLTP